MQDDTEWTQPKLLTFYERMKLTFVPLKTHCAMPAGWLRVVWSRGASVSFRLIEAKSVSLHIASGNGLRTFDLTIANRHETAL
jgi:hypothetical protein